MRSSGSLRLTGDFTLICRLLLLEEASLLCWKTGGHGPLRPTDLAWRRLILVWQGAPVTMSRLRLRVPPCPIPTPIRPISDQLEFPSATAIRSTIMRIICPNSFRPRSMPVVRRRVIARIPGITHERQSITRPLRLRRPVRILLSITPSGVPRFCRLPAIRRTISCKRRRKSRSTTSLLIRSTCRPSTAAILLVVLAPTACVVGSHTSCVPSLRPNR